MPLALAAPGERLRVEGVGGGGEAARQLTDLGLTVGAELEVISANGGPMVVAVGGSRVALGRGAAHKVQVSQITAKEG
jgi:Fe2+ transport system protein FeoA